VAATLALAVTSATTAAYAALVVVPGLAGCRPCRSGRSHHRDRRRPRRALGQYGVVSAGLVHYTRHRVTLLTSAEAAAGFFRPPATRSSCYPVPSAGDHRARRRESVHEMAAGHRGGGPRLDRLFGDRSPFEDGLVAVTNRPAEAP
jgi:hypothetical protein